MSEFGQPAPAANITALQLLEPAVFGHPLMPGTGCTTVQLLEPAAAGNTIGANLETVSHSSMLQAVGEDSEMENPRDLAVGEIYISMRIKSDTNLALEAGSQPLMTKSTPQR
jgi:hypothetical protein